MAVISFRECYAEFMGVFALVYFGGWGVVLALNRKQDSISVGLIYAAVISVATWISAKHSACHFNPSVTLGGIILKSTAPVKGASYIVSQFAGSYIAAVLLDYTIPLALKTGGVSDAYLGMPRLSGEIKWVSTAGFEVVGTAIAAIAIFSLSEQKTLRSYAPAIGCVYGLLYMCLGNVQSTSFNPFRYLGPALVSFEFVDFAIYLFPSLVGGVLGAFLFDFLSKGVKAENLLEQNAKIE
jgi:glycerol uptake facilitator-like aquaporin